MSKDKKVRIGQVWDNYTSIRCMKVLEELEIPMLTPIPLEEEVA